MPKPDIRAALARSNGLLPLIPQLVHRFYPDLNRLAQSRLKRSPKQFIPERWIGSSVQAINPPPIPSGGLSMIAGAKPALSLRDAVKAEPELLLGAELAARHGAEFRVLVKILDPGEPIVFHIHATDEQVRRMPGNFAGHRFGKDEAYYFLDAPKGPQPYTHAGLYPGVTRRQLVAAVEKGPQHALELSPVMYQHYAQGFFVPAGIPHRPGTALTLEIQQPSDVYTLLETHAGGKRMPPQQIHPGFRSLDEAFKLIDFDLAYAVGQQTHNRLIPAPVQPASRGNTIDWVFPLDKCRKFGGKRLRIASKLTYREDRPFVLWCWKGKGTANNLKLSRGAELFAPVSTATAGVELANTGDELLEVFSFFPGE